MSDVDTISISQTFLNFIISIITVITGIFFFIKWGTARAEKNNTFKISTNKDIDSIVKSVERLSSQVEELKRKTEDEIIQSREEHAKMQKDYYDMMKQLYQLIGQVKEMRKSGSND